MPAPLKTLPQDLIPLMPFNLVGVDALRQLLQADAAGVVATTPPVTAMETPALSS
jgi:arsenite-transporting ATPase